MHNLLILFFKPKQTELENWLNPQKTQMVLYVRKNPLVGFVQR